MFASFALSRQKQARRNLFFSCPQKSRGLSNHGCLSLSPSLSLVIELSIDLTDNIQVYVIFISVDSLARNDLRDNGVVRVNFIFNGGVEDLLPHGVGNDDKEELNDGLLWLILRRGLTLLGTSLYIDVVPEVGVNSVLEVLDR